MHMSLTRSLSAAALAFLTTCGFASLASAQESQGCRNKEPAVTRDVEGGDQLTASSHMTGATKRFEMMDADKNGKVTAAEINASRGAESIVWASEQPSAREKIKELDTNRDGVLTVREYADNSQKMFDRLDANGDGVLTGSEMLKNAR